MAESLYGTPVDAAAMAIRADPETPLIVYPMERASLAQVFLSQPASWPALGSRDRASLGAYFEWEDRHAYWWSTMRPAVVSLERVASGLWAGRLVEQGVVLAAGNDPMLLPDAPSLVRVQFAPTESTLRVAHGPYVDADASAVLRASSMRIIEATFPMVEPSAVWLRQFEPGAERQAHLAALDHELTVNRMVSAREPSLVPTILHEGRLETAIYSGRYVATERRVGLPCDEALLSSGKEPWSSREAVIRAIVAEVARLMVAAHAEGHCVGPLSPGLLRVRPSFSAWPASSRVVVLAMPAAGPQMGRVPPSVMELFPEGQSDHLVSQFQRPYRRSVKADLKALGHLLAWLLESVSVTEEPLASLASTLQAGAVDDASAALARLSVSVGSDMP